MELEVFIYAINQFANKRKKYNVFVSNIHRNHRIDCMLNSKLNPYCEASLHFTFDIKLLHLRPEEDEFFILNW